MKKCVLFNVTVFKGFEDERVIDEFKSINQGKIGLYSRASKHNWKEYWNRYELRVISYDSNGVEIGYNVIDWRN